MVFDESINGDSCEYVYEYDGNGFVSATSKEKGDNKKCISEDVILFGVDERYSKASGDDRKDIYSGGAHPKPCLIDTKGEKEKARNEYQGEVDEKKLIRFYIMEGKYVFKHSED